MKILAIETSCDETSIAIIETRGAKHKPRVYVRAHLVSSQIKLHAQFGGVVPNLAKREHQRLLAPLLMKALKESRIKNQESRMGKNQNQIKRDSCVSFVPLLYKEGLGEVDCKNLPLLTSPVIREEPDVKVLIKEILNREPFLLSVFEKKILTLPVPDIDAIAVTNGPGLAPALWVGINFAKALALIWRKPIIPMNHMKGHVFSALLQCGKKNDQCQILNFKFPLLALLVSGGHTELVLIKKFGSYKIIGETLDDAAGEAFDKVARMLGLGYPGGPAIAEAAIQKTKGKRQNEAIASYARHVIARSSSDEAISKYRLLRHARNDTKTKIRFPRPMITSSDFNFSFSGLKTSVLYFIRDLGDKKSVRAYTPAIAKEFQDAVVDVLVSKTMRAAREYGAKTIAIGGGVSASRVLRERLSEEVKKMEYIDLLLPDCSLTGDNALMIALAAAIDGTKKAPTTIGAEANMRLTA